MRRRISGAVATNFADHAAQIVDTGANIRCLHGDKASLSPAAAYLELAFLNLTDSCAAHPLLFL